MTNGRLRETIIIAIANAVDRCIIIIILYKRDVRRADLLLIYTPPRDDDE